MINASDANKQTIDIKNRMLLKNLESVQNSVINAISLGLFETMISNDIYTEHVGKTLDSLGYQASSYGDNTIISW